MKDLCSDREIRLKFLLEAGKILQSKCPSVATYLNTYGSNLARNFNSSIPSSWTKKNVVCLYCLTPWSRNNYSVSLHPTVKPNKKIKYIIRKKTKSKSCSNIENKLVALVHSGNQIILKCLTCSEKTSFLINKGQGQTLIASDKKQTNRKKKKKDHLAGLSPSVREIVKELNEKAESRSRQVFQTGATNNELKRVCELENQGCKSADIISVEDEKSKLYDQIYSNRWACSLDKEKPAFNLRMVAPLGSKPSELGSSSGADVFIPLNLRSEKKRKFGNDDFHQKSDASPDVSKKKPTKFINPFALANQDKPKKKQKKRIDHLQQIIAEEKNKSKGKSSSFRDFLSLI